MLEKEIVRSINNYLDQKGICFSNEIRMGIGIPDISFNLGANYKLKVIDDYYLLAIQVYIENKLKVTLEEIKKEFLLTLDRIKKYVYTLAKMRFVKINGQFVKALKSVFSTRLGTTISIEAKLKDWKGACLQAQRYLLFSDYVYVAMPLEYIKNVDDEMFFKSNVGLLSIDSNEIKEIIPAKKSSSCDFIQKYLATSKIAEKYEGKQKKHLRNNIFTEYAKL